MLSAPLIIAPAAGSDKKFLAELYASTRASEMAFVPWSREQKEAFLQSQFEAQDLYYRERYPNATFDLIKINGNPVGRLYLAELEDEFRIIDLAFLPAHFDAGVFVTLIEEILLKGAKAQKPVRTFLENNDPQIETFVRLGFHKTGEHGIYFLFQRNPAELKAVAEV